MPYWFDGNNLIGQSVATARREPKKQESFLALLSHYTTSRGGRFTVFFDGDDPGVGRPPRGVRVRFSAPLSTDDAILNNIKGVRNPEEIIVVTNDRALASRCRTCGVKAMDWRQFTRKMERTPRAHRGEAGKDEKVDVDEWLRYFGFPREKPDK